MSALQQAAEPAFSFAGEDAQDAPVASLHMARARLAQGEDAQVVRAQTGWFSGVDGRWRFEIDDSSASLKPLTEAAQLALSQDGKVQVVLADVIDHPRLLHAYPALAGMPVELVKDHSGGLYVSGVNGEDPGHVVIGAFLREGQWQVLGFSILLHEVQHAIQRREGFAIGGTPSIQAWASGDLRPHLLRQTQALVSEMEPPSYETYWGVERSAEGEAAYAEFLKEWHSPEYQRQLWQASQQGAAARVYQNLAGEVEARDVQRRKGLSVAQRLSTPPALSAGVDGFAQDLVVVFNGQDMHDASGINAAPMSLKEVRAIWTALGIEHFVSEKAGRVHVSQFIVPKHLRGQGVGTQAMQALAAYADASGQRLELSPSTDFGATSKARLQRFYRRFGFVANQGKRRDFTTTETMLREPKGTGFMDLRPNPDRQELRTYKVGDTTMVLSVSPFEPGVVHLSSLRTPVTKRGKGSARAAMQALLAQADRQGVSINLTASALDRQTNQTGLRIFYRSLGFEDTGRRMNAWGHPEMVRHAKPTQVGERQIPEMLEVDGVIRPTRNSRGMLIHTKPEAIEQFWRWYAGQGEPGLLDADGRPQVLYHGTNEDLDHLDPMRERAVRAPQSVHAVFATDDQKVASEFALYRSVWAGANVMPIYARTDKVLKINGRGKPIRMVEAEIDTARLAAWSMSRRGDMAGVEQVWTALEALIGVNLSGMEPSIDETLRSYAKRMGFDAMVFNEVTDDVGPEIPRASNIHVLLDPVDIKSATGNLGTYDSQQDSLRMSVAQRPAAASQEEAEVQEALARALSFSQPNLLGLPKASESMQWLAKGTNDVGPVYRGHGIELHAVAQIQQDDFDSEAGFARFGLMGHAARCVPGTRTYAFKVVQPGTHKVMGTLVSDVDQEGRIVSVHDIATVAPGKGHGTRVMTHLVANAPDNTIKVQEITNESEEFWRRIHIGYIDTYRDAQLESGFIHRTPSTDVAQPVSGGHAHRAGDRAYDRASTAKGSQLDPASAAVAGEMGRGQGQGLDFAAQWALISEREEGWQRAREADLASDMVGLEVSEVDSLAFADDLGFDFAHIGRRWVKDERGADLKLYHGTNAVFAEFGPNPRGIFLAEDPAKAGTFKAIRKGGEPRVIEARINVNKVWEVIRYGDDVPYSQMIDQSVDALKKQGYDAMHCPDDGVWIVFDPKQIDILRQDIDQEVDEADEVAARVAAEMEDVRQLYGKASHWLKAPNGEPTKLSQRQWLLVRTDSFKAWFGDWQKDPINASKALDDNGEPKVYFHGSKEAGFTEFVTDGRRKTEGTGAFFTSNRQMARGYSGGSEKTPVYLPEQIFKDPDPIDGLEIEKGVLVSVVVSSQGRKAWSWFESEQQAREELELAADDPIESKEGYRVLVDGYEELVGDKQAVLDHLTDMRSKEAGMYEVFLNIRDMVDVDWGGQNWDQGPQEDIWDIEDAGGNQLDWAYSEEDRDAMLASNPGSVAVHRTQSVYDSSDDAARQARQMGADGILIRNISDTGPDGYADDGNVFVVFESENIKWADNVGSFDPGMSDIRFSIPVKEDVELPAKGNRKPLNLTLKAGHKGYF
ncbi:MAG: GNAT family N-acetyltransferase, partial [Burkholderiales bacterium]|nr:GNAT family N-acetyltransferase [Burkholderiales bacterium]